ncbi:sigma factor-like helix-turn-helix DNA-binding protein [Solibacillus sp. FSL H8-0523]|uniref:sigma factor-like helix-turn-helix DNA-binding protein n=1 Tax=Solibacillus sp. FSL H8-0523 TaxID=2954511 RepID=UPI0031012BA0
MYFPDLIEQYKQLLKQMKSEGVTSGELYREVKQAVEWMETGYDPAEFRASTRVDAYPVDPYHMQTYMAYANDDHDMLECMLNLQNYIESHKDEQRFKADWRKAEDNKKKVNSAMKGLTADEKAVFVAIEAERLPFSKVARMLGVSKSTVQSYYERARKKISENLNKGSQLDMFEMIS